MRKTFYLPEHIKDRLLKFRQKHEMMEEQVAIIRLIDTGLAVEEGRFPPKEEKVDDAYTPPRTWVDEWQKAWGNFYNMSKINGRIR